MEEQFKRGSNPLKVMNIGNSQLIKDFFQALEYQEEEYYLFDDLTIHIKNLFLSEYLPLPEFIKFRSTGLFDGTHCELTSLQNVVPEIVELNFDCSNNQLSSLDYLPEFIGKNFFCFENSLLTLEGSPKFINGNFDCDHNQLTSLKGGPEKVNGNFSCSYNPISTIEGAPKEVIGDYIMLGYNGRFTEKNIRDVTKVFGNVILTDEDFRTNKSKITEMRNKMQW